MYPSYFNLDLKTLGIRAEEARDRLHNCDLCPRSCGANRLPENGDRQGNGQPISFCGVIGQAVVSSFFPHMGEEDCLRGTRGSGTIFFSGCNLKCVFCQNSDISHRLDGENVSAKTLGSIMLRLQDLGCHNINLVTPTHVVPFILEGLVHAIEAGLRRPFVYNTNAYDSVDTLSLLDGIVDIYMPDFKFWSDEDSKRYLNAADYPAVARRAHREMFRQVGSLVLDPYTGLAIRGMLVRHLVMPDKEEQTSKIFHFLAERLSPHTYVNVMGQYRPCHHAFRYPEISRRPTRDEMLKAFEAAKKAGLYRFDHRVY